MRHAGLAALFLLASAAPTRADPLTIHALAAAHGLAGMHSLDKLPAPPTLRLRAGEHFGFSRLVMDLPLGVTPQVTVGPDSVLLTLPGTRLELPAVRPRHVRAIAAEGDGIAITLAPGARLRRADLMGRLVFDLLDPLPRACPQPCPFRYCQLSQFPQCRHRLSLNSRWRLPRRRRCFRSPKRRFPRRPPKRRRSRRLPKRR